MAFEGIKKTIVKILLYKIEILLS